MWRMRIKFLALDEWSITSIEENFSKYSTAKAHPIKILWQKSTKVSKLEFDADVMDFKRISSEHNQF